MERDTLKNTVKETAHSARKAGEDALQSVKNEAGNIASSASDTLRSEAEIRAEQGKEEVSRQGAKFSQALRDRAERAEGDIERRVLDVLAGSVAEMSDSLQGRSITSLVDDTERFARRHPGVFVAGAAVAGFALARFARAGRTDSISETETLPVPDVHPSAPQAVSLDSPGMAAASSQTQTDRTANNTEQRS